MFKNIGASPIRTQGGLVPPGTAFTPTEKEISMMENECWIGHRVEEVEPTAIDEMLGDYVNPELEVAIAAEGVDEDPTAEPPESLTFEAETATGANGIGDEFGGSDYQPAPEVEAPAQLEPTAKKGGRRRGR